MHWKETARTNAPIIHIPRVVDRVASSFVDSCIFGTANAVHGFTQMVDT